jgi:hypothetical protein
MLVKQIDDDAVLQDGEVLRVPFIWMDAEQRAVATNSVAITDNRGHKPGYAHLTDADMTTRQKACDAYDAAVSSRWKAPPSVPAAQVPAQNRAVADAIATYETRLTERWKGAAQ